MTSRKDLAVATEARLRTIANVSRYVGDVPTTPPTITVTDLRVKPYWVLYTGVGRPVDARFVGPTVGNSWGFQVTAAAGRMSDLNQLIDAIVAKLDRWNPFPDECRPCRMDQDFIPGPALRDDDFKPVRFWTPLPFKIPTKAEVA